MVQASRFNGTLVTLLSVGSNDTTNQCPGNNVQPSTWEIYQGLGPAYAVGLWISVGLICLVLLLEYIYLYLVFVRQVPRSRRESTMWINSMFFVPTFFSYLCILLPKSAPFVWLFYRKIVFVKDSYSKHFDEPGLAGFFLRHLIVGFPKP